MKKQGYNYLDGPIQSMAKFFETRIEILEKSISPNVPSKCSLQKQEKERKKSQ